MTVARNPNVVVLDRRYHEPHGNLRVMTSRRLVALSFDDGPSPRYTRAVLRDLRRAGAHATFFVIGIFAARYPALIHAELSAGDEVANHTLDHPQLANQAGQLRVPPALLHREVIQGRDAVCRAGAPAPALFRAPYGRGLFNSEVVAAARSAGELVVGWDLALDRYLQTQGSTKASVAALIARTRPGTIVLAHDGQAHREATLHALPRLLAGLHRHGYRVVSITTLLRSVGAH